LQTLTYINAISTASPSYGFDFKYQVCVMMPASGSERKIGRLVAYVGGGLFFSIFILQALAG
jgi:hypothetical protein